jgi:hypothetical protein
MTYSRRTREHDSHDLLSLSGVTTDLPQWYFGVPTERRVAGFVEFLTFAASPVPHPNSMVLP